MTIHSWFLTSTPPKLPNHLDLNSKIKWVKVVAHQKIAIAVIISCKDSMMIKMPKLLIILTRWLVVNNNNNNNNSNNKANNNNNRPNKWWEMTLKIIWILTHINNFIPKTLFQIWIILILWIQMLDSKICKVVVIQCKLDPSLEFNKTKICNNNKKWAEKIKCLIMYSNPNQTKEVDALLAFLRKDDDS